VANVWGEPTKINSYTALRLIRDLNNKQRVVSTGGVFYNEDSLQARGRYSSFTTDNAIQEMLKMSNVRHHWEQKRVGQIQEEPPVFIVNKKEGV